MSKLTHYRIPIWNVGLWRQSALQRFFGQPFKVALLPAAAPAAWLCWGAKPSGRWAAWYAARSRQPLLRLEDGFLRSCGLGVHGAPPLSLVVDDLGIYYDATRPSRLEVLIETIQPDSARAALAADAIARILRHRLSKYNHAPAVSLPPCERKRVLVIDQTFGDVSVTLGGADSAAFAAMLAAALDEHPDAEIVVKVHPDVVSGKKQGYLGILADQPGRVRLLAQDVSPLHLLDQVDEVYVVTSQMGFEALLLGKPVTCFGLPWYAGWGPTRDRHPGMASLRVRRSARRSVAQLFEAAYLGYCRYLDPVSGLPGTIFDVIDWLARNKAINDATRGEIYCTGMTAWKRAIVKPFLGTPSSRLHFLPSVEDLAAVTLPPDSRILLWGTKNEAQLTALARSRQLPVWRMEDGFLRSVGLGSDLFRPVSLVVDPTGMYYDPYSGSALETMLSTQQLDADALARAARFRHDYVNLKLSKYNLKRSGLQVDGGGRRIILVPGQVEDDASIMRGSPQVRTNLALLEAVRAANPGACILYKAHPDVVAGNRQGMVPAAALARLADQCVNDANIIDCILAVDEVHTMTSLSGFEALLHGRIVHCYGGPFYAGWGLTVDHLALPHRQARISLDALVHAVLLAYPRYVLPGVAGFVAAEDVMRYLVRQSAALDHTSDRGKRNGWLSRKLRKMGALLALYRNR